jgi:hypothetical protein
MSAGPLRTHTEIDSFEKYQKYVTALADARKHHVVKTIDWAVVESLSSASKRFGGSVVKIDKVGPVRS